MPDRKCPLCGSRKFFVREPGDDYDMIEFECRNCELVPCVDRELPAIADDTETHCCRCTWRGQWASLPSAH